MIRIVLRPQFCTGYVIILMLFLTISALPALAQISETKLTPSDAIADDRFASAVSLGQDRALIGAPRGFLGNNQVGAAYIYDRQADGSWAESKLSPNEVSAEAMFGFSVALLGDLAFVGAPEGGTDLGSDRTGTVYVFERQPNGSWFHLQVLTPGDGSDGDLFGSAISPDGDRVLVGAKNTGIDEAGAAYIFERQPDGFYDQIAMLVGNETAQGDHFGHAVALRGQFALISSPDSGQDGKPDSGTIHVFERYTESFWMERQRFSPSDGANGDMFGSSMSIWEDRLLVGASGDDSGAGENTGSAYVFEQDDSGSWTEIEKLTPAEAVGGDLVGISVGLQGDVAVLGASAGGTDTSPESGNIHIFERDRISGDWREDARIVPSDGADDDMFGRAVDMLDNRMLVGAPYKNTGEGAAYVLDFNAPRIAAFTLYDTETDLPVPEFDPLRSGSVIYRSQLPRFHTIRAHSTGEVESIRFDFDGESNFSTDNVPPYALFGDVNGDYFNGRIRVGEHTLTATPFTADSGLGEAGESLTISFTIERGSPGVASSESDLTDQVQQSFQISAGLVGNYPNPFNPSTTIRYHLAEPSYVRLIVYNLLGQEIAILAAGRHQAGSHQVQFDAEGLPTGMYMYRLETPSRNYVGKMLLAK